MSRTATFYVNSINAYLFEIKDQNGEITRVYKELEIGVAPVMLFSLLQNEKDDI